MLASAKLYEEPYDMLRELDTETEWAAVANDIQRLVLKQKNEKSVNEALKVLAKKKKKKVVRPDADLQAHTKLSLVSLFFSFFVSDSVHSNTN